ncbi:MAG: transposase [Kineosporiaceae bacterium]
MPAVAALRRCFQGRRINAPGALRRNLLALIPKSHKDMVAALFRTIFATRPASGSRRGRKSAISSPGHSRRSVRDGLRQGRSVGVHRFSPIPLGEDLVNNPLERINKEIKRRSRVVGIFPNEAAVIRLVGSVLADTHDEWQVHDRRFSEASMACWQPSP